MYNFEPYNVLLAIATNIPVLLKTAFVLQGHNLKEIMEIGHIFMSELHSTHNAQLSEPEHETWCFELDTGLLNIPTAI